MKKIISVFLVLMLIFLCSCNKNGTDGEITSSDASGAGEGTELNGDASSTELRGEITTVASLEIEEIDPAKVYIVYFTHETDSMEDVAEYIAGKTEAKLHKVETVAEYPAEERELVKVAQQEYNDNIRPALKNAPTDMIDYDIVFLCFPIWNNTMPMALWTFLEDYDMRDKAVVPICYGTNNQLNNAIADMNAINKSMMVVGGYSFINDFSEETAEFDVWMNTALYG